MMKDLQDKAKIRKLVVGWRGLEYSIIVQIHASQCACLLIYNAYRTRLSKWTYLGSLYIYFL